MDTWTRGWAEAPYLQVDPQNEVVVVVDEDALALAPLLGAGRGHPVVVAELEHVAPQQLGLLTLVQAAQRSELSYNNGINEFLAKRRKSFIIFTTFLPSLGTVFLRNECVEF